MTIRFLFAILIFVGLISSCDKTNSSKEHRWNKLDEIKLDFYSVNANKFGIRYDSIGRPNRNDSVLLLSCNAVLVKNRSFFSKDSSRYFFKWQDKRGKPLSGLARDWFFTKLIYKNDTLVGAGYENLIIDFRGYNYEENVEFKEGLKQNKWYLNRWLYLYAKHKKLI
ncbi:hypothetical protein [Haliscomenobacter hydrossis]|uniref:Lipoprotein n=1 Tax=Haliscomenobacter hydrossis (strain ATCC 27775 / DSM 1100 / LMG 10767 / O) TaxID=760192 RepID=F4L2F4_HALH1|nr:hypothetical protein [Haliscomenobacter hydrossis]AEE52907.1 hypothetical protein Halhy_5081 [Haliscomenobacter hydrossis DSM 1100]